MSLKEKIGMFALGVATCSAAHQIYSWSKISENSTPTTEPPLPSSVPDQTVPEAIIDKMQIDDSGPNSEIQICVVPYSGYGVPRLSNFKVVSCVVPELKDGQVLVESRYISVDPYLRGRMSGMKVEDVPVSGTVAEIIKSRAEGFKVGELIFQYLPWRKINVVIPTLSPPGSKTNPAHFRKLGADLPPSTALGVAGMPGFTAYVGLLYIGQLMETDKTVFVSGAAGAVGTIVGQIAKLKKCRVIGTCGSAAKCKYLTEELGFDVALNYKEYGTTTTMHNAIKKVCPEGIDVYFENTGGHTTEAVMNVLNFKARVAVCGQIAYYNSKKTPMTEAFLMKTIYKCIRIEGFVQNQYLQYHDEFLKDIAKWINNGSVKYRETIVDGFNNVPKAFVGLFSGKNTGKMVIKV